MNYEPLKATGDIVAGSVALATLFAWLPPLAALVTLIYTVIRILETDTVKRLRSKWK